MSQDPRNFFYENRYGYKENERPTENKETAKQPDAKPSEQEINRRIEEMKQIAKKYEKAGEGQLVNDIVNNVIEQKARGQLTNDQLIAFAKRVSPLLNSEQKQRLNGLLEQLLKL
ncbi:MAG: hypothetical protein NC350_02515 [Corallococcus sp.]|nr:hypothetical protein [Corallococcus sp.]